jgi:hypothetical protein
MPNYVREAAIDRLVTVLEGITTGGGWATTLAPTVRKVRQDAFSLAVFPQILVIPRQEALTERAVAGNTLLMDSTLTVQLDCWLESWDMSTDISKMIHDVIKAVADDPLLNGTIRDHRFTGTQTFIMEDEQPTCGVSITLDLIYGFIETDPSALA